MITGSLSEWAAAMGGELLGGDGHFVGVSTDTRSQAQGALFFALRGERFDGADFLPAAISGGAAGAVLSSPLPQDIPQIIVKDTRGALADCASAWRKRFDMPVIGITGSNGKTTVKELTAAILRAEWGAQAVLASPRSFNNEIGLAADAIGLFGIAPGSRAGIRRQPAWRYRQPLRDRPADDRGAAECFAGAPEGSGKRGECRSRKGRSDVQPGV